VAFLKNTKTALQTTYNQPFTLNKKYL